MIRLNVGGKKFTTSIETLSREPNSMLAKLASDRWQKNGTKEIADDSNENEIFVDR